MAGTDPVVGFPSGINLLDDLRIVPLVAEFREEDPFRTEGDVDGEDLPLLEGVVQEEGISFRTILEAAVKSYSPSRFSMAETARAGTPRSEDWKAPATVPE